MKELSELQRVARVPTSARRPWSQAKAISAGEFQTREGDYLSKKAAADAAERALHLYGDSEAEVARLRARVESDADGASDSEAAPAGRSAPPSTAAWSTAR